MLPLPRVNPARSYDEALERVRAFKMLDDSSILQQARTALFDRGSRAPIAVVLLHGFTNNPAQFAQFAPMVHERGANVFIPRLPEHGDADRLTRRLQRLTAERLLESATEAVDIACGLGDRVCVLGISSSGTLGAYFAQYRSDVSRAIGVAPFFSMLQLPYWVSRLAANTMLLLPDRFLWWDPRAKEAQEPLTAYPQFPMRALAQTLRIANAVYDESLRAPLAGGGAIMMMNASDPAVNNRVTQRVVRNWSRLCAGCATPIVFTDLPRNHDIIDPSNPKARTDLIYPRLLEQIYAP